jgi:hypothetical protein
MESKLAASSVILVPTMENLDIVVLPHVHLLQVAPCAEMLQASATLQNIVMENQQLVLLILLLLLVQYANMHQRFAYKMQLVPEAVLCAQII